MTQSKNSTHIFEALRMQSIEKIDVDVYDAFVRGLVEQGDGWWTYEWADKHGLPAVAPNAYHTTWYEWTVNTTDAQYRVVVTVAYSPDEVARCKKINLIDDVLGEGYDLSSLPVDWEHVVEYTIKTMDGMGGGKQLMHRAF